MCGKKRKAGKKRGRSPSPPGKKARRTKAGRRDDNAKDVDEASLDSVPEKTEETAAVPKALNLAEIVPEKKV